MLVPADRIEIEALLTEFGWLIDHGEGGRVADLFLPEGSLIFLGQHLQGRDAIRATMHERSGDGGRVVRHLWSSLRLLSVGDKEVRFETVAMTVLANAQTPWDKAIMVGDTHDIVRRDDAGAWRFAQRMLENAMPFGPSPS